VPGDDAQSGMVYSRIDAPGRARAEALVSELEGGHAVLYASGLAALWAALVFFSPARIVMHAGYHGTLFAVWSQVPDSVRRVEQPDATTLMA
jgi:O-acetylhomoserine/O-acetylserine sulfhydrylase-like pyridoxal-dependent enzyme